MEGSKIPSLKQIIGEELLKSYQIGKLKEEYKDVNGLKDKVSKLEENNKKQKDDFEAKIQSMNLSNALDKALGKYKAKDSKLIKVLLDYEKLKVDRDTVIGLKEQMEAIKKDRDYLFEKEIKGYSDFNTGNPPENKSIGSKLAASITSNKIIKKLMIFKLYIIVDCNSL